MSLQQQYELAQDAAFAGPALRAAPALPGDAPVAVRRASAPPATAQQRALAQHAAWLAVAPSSGNARGLRVEVTNALPVDAVAAFRPDNFGWRIAYSGATGVARHAAPLANAAAAVEPAKSSPAADRPIRRRRQSEVRDPAMPGLFVATYPSGRKTYILRFRNPVTGRKTSKTLGVVE